MILGTDAFDVILDPSHAQDIGSMLYKHSVRSLFIMVSLKMGVRTIANVLTRMKFMDGANTIT